MVENAEIIYVQVTREVDRRKRTINYVAINQDLGIMTVGHNFDKLLENLEDAIRLSMQDLDTETAYGIAKKPRIILQMELDNEVITTTEVE